MNHRGRIPAGLVRELHPGAWWLWALGMAAAVSRTTDPVLCLLAATVVVVVVSVRRHDGPWRAGLRGWVIVALVIVAFRVVLRVLLDAQHGSTVLFRLPEIPLPEVAAGVRLGGPVSAEAILGALYDGMRLAAVILCVGAANVLADTRRLLKAAPSALAEVASALTIALSVAPQLADSAARVRRARSLRVGSSSRRRAMSQIVVPVVTDALDRSVALASAMEARGHGRVSRTASSRRRSATAAMVVVGLVGTCIGTYGLLAAATTGAAGAVMLAAGTAVAVAGVVLGRRGSATTRYRPDPWTGAEWTVAAAGLAAAAVLGVASILDPSSLNPPTQPLAWPATNLVAFAGLALGLVPAVAGPARRFTSTAGGRGRFVRDESPRSVAAGV